MSNIFTRFAPGVNTNVNPWFYYSKKRYMYPAKFLSTTKSLAFLLITLLFLSSCSDVGLLSEKNSWIVRNIDSFGDFFKVYFVLQISIILTSLILGTFLGNIGYIISLAIHFIWIISARDYGFFIVLLLFGLFSIISFLFQRREQ